MNEIESPEKQEAINEIQKQIDQLVVDSFDEMDQNVDEALKVNPFVFEFMKFPSVAYTSNIDGGIHRFRVPRKSWLGAVNPESGDQATFYILAKKIVDFSLKKPGFNPGFYSAYGSYRFFEQLGEEFLPDLTDEQKTVVFEYLKQFAIEQLSLPVKIDEELLKKIKPIFEQFPNQITSYLETYEEYFKSALQIICKKPVNIEADYPAMANGIQFSFGLHSIGQIDATKRSDRDISDFGRASKLYETDEFRAHITSQLENFRSKQ